MKALLYSEVGHLKMVEMPVPQAGPGEVRVRVRATGICGSDIHGFLGHQARRKPGLVLGHETTGVVDSVGPGGDESLIGQRVAVNPLITCRVCDACRSGRQNCCATWRLLGMDQTHGGFAEQVVVPAINVHPLPDSVNDEEAVMIEPLANAIELLSKIPAHSGLFPDTLILGAGTLGACILSVAKARGLNVVAVSEKNADRRGVALSLGAKSALDPAELASLPPVPVVVDAVGRAETRETALKRAAKGGTVLLLGLDEGATTLDFQDVVRREVRLQGSFAYNDLHFKEALEFVVERRADFRSWTDTMPLEQGQDGFERLINAPGDRLKIALIP